MSNPNYELLSQAIDRSAAAVLSLPSAGMIRHHKTRFLAATENGFWIESAEGEAPLLDELINVEGPVGVSFKAGHSSIVFATPVQRRLPDFRVNPTTVVEALFLPFPDAFRQNQRRSVYRVGMPLEHPIAIRVWRIAEHAILRDRPMAAQEIHVRLVNVSVMGMGMNCAPGRDGRPQRVLAGERLRILLDYKGETVVMEGRVIHIRPIPSHRLMMGLQLKKLEKDMEGRQALSKLTALVGELQRDEIRRRKAIAEAA